MVCSHCTGLPTGQGSMGSNIVCKMSTQVSDRNRYQDPLLPIVPGPFPVPPPVPIPCRVNKPLHLRTICCMIRNSFFLSLTWVKKLAPANFFLKKIISQSQSAIFFLHKPMTSVANPGSYRGPLNFSDFIRREKGFLRNFPKFWPSVAF